MNSREKLSNRMQDKVDLALEDTEETRDNLIEYFNAQIGNKIIFFEEIRCYLTIECIKRSNEMKEITEI